ncbi:MAG: RNA methyltransferase [Paramuribaculum sp.]|nr:RNA methyltransferase [Paramuribaculum sp.]
MNQQFEMVAKTFHGLEEVLAEELRALGAVNVEPGRRMVSFEGDLAMLYRANMCCRTALRILKPIYKFIARDSDELYEMVKEFDWTRVLSLDKTFSLDTVSNSDEFTHSRFVTYRVKDAIVDFFKDKYGPDKRPGVRLQDADVMINVHISGERVTLSLDSSGESLHKRGYRVAQTEAPINEVLAAGIILKSGWRGDCPLVDPMCGSGTFLIEAALIGAGIMPGIYRKRFAFEAWPDFDADLFDSIYNDESSERDFTARIYGADISPKAVAIAEANIKQAGVGRYIDLRCKGIGQWEDAPADGILVTNPPYGERIGSEDMDGLYRTIGNRLKHVFVGYHAWIIGYREEYFNKIGLTPSVKETLYNGSLECELREYVIFDGEYNAFRRGGGSIRHGGDAESSRGEKSRKGPRRMSDSEWRDDARRKGFGGKEARSPRKGGSKPRSEEKFASSKGHFADKPRRDDRRDDRRDNRFADRRSERFSRDRQSAEERQPSENPLAVRRNEQALKMLRDKKPSLPPGEKTEGGVVMRSRRGWKKNDD